MPRSPDSARVAGKPCRLEQVDERLSDERVVVDDEDLGHAWEGSLAPAAAGVKTARYTSDPESPRCPRTRSPQAVSHFSRTPSARSGRACSSSARGSEALRVRLEAGQIVALGPAPAEDTLATPMPKPNDSVRLRLERVLSEIGMRKARRAPRRPSRPRGRCASG